MNKSLPFQFRKWGLNEHHGSNGCSTCVSGSSDDASQELPFTTLIHYAAQIGHVPLLRLFKHEEVASRLEGYLVHERCRAFLVACFNEQIDVVEHILLHYAEYVDYNEFKEALHRAIYRGHENTICTLLPYASAWGADLSAALPNAIHQGKVSCAERLITAGARFDVSTPEHDAALHAAIKGRLDSIIAMLVYKNQVSVADVYDIDLEGRNEAGSRGIFFAARRGLPLTLEAMLLAGAAINECDVLGKTALHYAAERGHSFVNMVLESTKKAEFLLLLPSTRRQVMGIWKRFESSSSMALT